MQAVVQPTLRSRTLEGRNNQHALATNPLGLFDTEARKPPLFLAITSKSRFRIPEGRI